MYCQKCGDLLDKNGICINCGDVTLLYRDIVPSVTDMYQPYLSDADSTMPVPKSSLAKRAWYAPVALIFSNLASSVMLILANLLVQNFFTDSWGSSAFGYYSVNAFFSDILSPIISLIICYGLSLIVFEKIKYIKLLFLIPFAAKVFTSYFSTFLVQIALDCYNEHLISLNAYIAVANVAVLPAIILFAVISYFVCAKYLKGVDADLM